MSDSFPTPESSPSPNPAPIGFHLGLWAYFTVPFAILILLVLGAALGVFPAVLLFVFFALVVGLFCRGARLFCGVTLALLLAAGFLLPAGGRSREPVRRSAGANNSNRIAMALLQYEKQFGSLPPPYVCDGRGRPAHSWRVLILPFLGEAELYSKYSFAEPWDGPNNSKLLADIPRVFRCPSDLDSGTAANYIAVVGPETAWPGEKPRKSSEIVDRSHTILVVETTWSDIPWTAPRDLDLATLPLEISPAHRPSPSDPPPRPAISSRHPGGAHVAFADGNVAFLPSDISPEKLQQLLNVSGPKPKDLDW